MGNTTLSPEQLATLLEQAAEAGAKKALLAVGLYDADAAGDLHDLRGLLDAYRSARASMATAAIKFLTTISLAAIIAGLGFSALKGD